ncbi:aspartate/tyrosine/aromatic aminotransferase [Sphaerochaeta pleomorpha str. Grapes]|uniref:Aminotransferase n=1 Tax=Sphaerochaeta pleomorpha (strain ATCC BAA-1885 / DSM 22778 / Grapes) TaxID=158190 RepID=G8QX88_SPHPG|nr:pyridoxal phosphate-dependent aminotransferase [Sphaerochaeta pleomorpha]AEV30673.1 aspartate/tyrosine/aromatic aminotransferase [Sphaerochaeta pleomorpha str. Grapes]
MRMSNRISGFQCSPIRRLSPFAREAVQRGIRVYPLNIGQPDIKTPSQVIDAVHNYDEPIIAYGNSEGRQELRDALPAYYKKYGLDVKSEDILITTGGSEALQFAFMTLCDPYDEIIIPEPYYTNVSSFANIAMVSLVPVTSKLEDGFALPDISEFEKKITRKTGAILLCSPNNPTGYIYSAEELTQLLKLVKKHDIFLIVDEVYREFCYDGKSFSSVLAFPEYADRVICVDSFSKRYSMCGARVGALISKNKNVLESALKLAQARLCPPDIEQVAARAALDTDDSYLVEVKAEYEKRRDFIVEGLQQIDGVKCSCPKGAFYLVAELPVDDAERFAVFMLKDFNLDGETVMVAPCEDFYVTKGIGRRQVRIAYVLNTHDLARAVRCIDAGLQAYRRDVLKETI